MYFNLGNDINYPRIRRLLQSVQDKVSVGHLMNTERPLEDDDKYILTRHSNGLFSFKPNITRQGLLYCGIPGITDGATSYYGVNGVRSNHDTLLRYNVKLEQFRLLVESFPLYELLSKGINIGITKFIMGHPYGLASLYGLVSPYVVMTPSINVALYFATHKYDINNGYQRLEAGNTASVYIYNMSKPFAKDSRLSVLGLGVFNKTIEAKAIMYNPMGMVDWKDTDDMFRLDFTISEEICNDAEREINLHSTDDFLSKKLSSLDNTIYEEALKLNFAKNKRDNFETNRNALGNNIVAGSPRFTYEDLRGLDLTGIWYDMLDKVVCFTKENQAYLDYLKLVPKINIYKPYFNLEDYYEKK